MDNQINIDKVIKELKEKFTSIKENNLWESLRKGTGGMGYTFETLIGKDEDSSYFPDYKGIEIKTKYGYSHNELSLFSMNPKREDKKLYSKYLVDNYGKIINSSILSKNFTGNIYYKIFDKKINNFRFKLKIDLIENKLKLLIFDENYKFIDDKIYWNLDLLKDRIMIKLKYLALIKGYPYSKDGKKYYKFTNLDFFQLINVENFLKLIENSKIHINFNITATYNNGYIIKIRDRGTSFKLKMDSIDYLFKKL